PRDIIRSLSRTSVTVAALMIAVAVIIGVSVMVGSFRNTVVNWLDDILAADIYISPAGQTARVRSALAPEFINRVQRIEGVAGISRLRAVTVLGQDDGEIELRALSPEPDETERPMLWPTGQTEQLFARMDAGAVMVSEVFARRLNLPLDRPSTVTLITESGPREFPVVGIFYDYALAEVGYVLMRLDTYRSHWPADDSVTNVALFLQPDYIDRADAIAQDIQDTFAAEYQLSISSNRSLKVGALEVFDRTFTITAALRLLATVVAFIGVLSALMSLQLERTRELGTLRANGMSLPQLWGKTLLETGLMGIIAGLMAMPLGWLLAFVLIHFINLRSFGWTLQMYLDPAVFGTALVVALAAALLAGIYPIIRLNNMEIAAALREE
ncbi:MAG: ABC transporter permease, partial [Anaerolineae bacterium]|nr:ABC transporter permease [Anaerolineae bacterium]